MGLDTELLIEAELTEASEGQNRPEIEVERNGTVAEAPNNPLIDQILSDPRRVLESFIQEREGKGTLCAHLQQALQGCPDDRYIKYLVHVAKKKLGFYCWEAKDLSERTKGVGKNIEKAIAAAFVLELQNIKKMPNREEYNAHTLVVELLYAAKQPGLVGEVIWRELEKIPLADLHHYAIPVDDDPHNLCIDNGKHMKDGIYGGLAEIAISKKMMNEKEAREATGILKKFEHWFNESAGFSDESWSAKLCFGELHNRNYPPEATKLIIFSLLVQHPERFKKIADHFREILDETIDFPDTEEEFIAFLNSKPENEHFLLESLRSQKKLIQMYLNDPLIGQAYSQAVDSQGQPSHTQEISLEEDNNRVPASMADVETEERAEQKNTDVQTKARAFFKKMMLQLLGGQPDARVTGNVFERTWKTVTNQPPQKFLEPPSSDVPVPADALKKKRKKFLTPANASYMQRLRAVNKLSEKYSDDALPEHMGYLISPSLSVEMRLFAQLLRRCLGEEMSEITTQLEAGKEYDSVEDTGEMSLLINELRVSHRSILEMVLEDEIIGRLNIAEPKKGTDVEKELLLALVRQIEESLPVLETDHPLHWEVQKRLRSWLQFDDALVAGDLVLEGWKHLAKIPAISSEEFFGPEEGQKERQRRTRLEQAIGCGKYKAELEKWYEADAWDVAAALEDEIMARVFKEIMKFPNINTEEPQDGERPPSYKAGFPRHIVENTELTCFSGPWLMATMLLKCGIPYKNILYCNVFESPDASHFGSHGSLLVSNSLNEITVMDSGYRRMSRPLRVSFCKNQQMSRQMTDLFNEKGPSVISVEIENDAASTLRLPTKMQCMHPAAGIASTHMLHVGLSFMHEGKNAEARHAFELGLCFNPKDCDLLYYQGFLDFQEGKLETAGRYFWDALGVYDNHLLAEFSLGELTMQQGIFVEAFEHFSNVAYDPRSIWGDDGSLKEKAHANMIQLGHKIDKLRR